MDQQRFAKNERPMRGKQVVQQPGIQLFIGFFFLINCLMDCTLYAEELIYQFDQLGCATCNEYQLDFLYLVKLLQDSHPNVYANFPKKEFDQEKARLLKKFETVEDTVSFALQLQQFCARLSDAHTDMNLSPLFRSGISIFPIELTVLHEDFYLTAYSNKFGHSFLGAKVLNINGIPIPQVIQQLGRLVSCENEIARLRQICQILQIPKILHLMRLINNEESLPLTIKTLEGSELTVVFPSQSLRQVKNLWITLPRNTHPVTAYQKTGFTYRLFPDKGLCYFQWNVCRDRQAWTFLLHTMGAEQFTRFFGLTARDIEQYEDFRQVLSQMFTDMQNHQIHSLVIDLRDNKGGQSIFGDQFLYYLQQLPEVLKDYTGGIQLSPLLQHFNPTYFEEKKQEYEQVLGKEIVNLPYLVLSKVC